ncbi:MAG: hypothetical protein ACREAC_21105, partial [Blastocatellia bacterium]
PTLWQYLLPSMRLRNKTKIEPRSKDFAIVAVGVSASGAVGELYIEFEEASPESSSSAGPVSGSPSVDLSGQKLRLTRTGGNYVEYSFPIYSPHASETMAPLISENWVLTGGFVTGGRQVSLLNTTRPIPAMELTLLGSTAPVIRLQNSVACIADERGRVFVLDLVSGSVLRNIRI